MANNICPICKSRRISDGVCAECGRNTETGDMIKAFLAPFGEEDIGKYNAWLAECANIKITGPIDGRYCRAAESVNVVADIGGSGTRLALFSNGALSDIRYEHPNSMPELLDSIRKLTDDRAPSALALSVPGRMRDRQVIKCYFAPWLDGDPAETIARELSLRDEQIRIINDGEAHALSLKTQPNVQFGAIHISVGTGVGFGVLDENGDVLRSLSGENWEIGDIRPDMSASEEKVWRLLGSAHLDELQQRTDIDGCEHFGRMLGGFTAQLSLIFRPRTIGLSGGVIRHYWERLEAGFYERFNEYPDNVGQPLLSDPEVIVPDVEEAALTGLSTFF